MNIRTKWNLWQFIIPGVTLLCGYIGFVLHEAWVAVSVLWFIATKYMISKYKCKKCKRILNLYNFEEMSVVKLYYWPYGTKLKCPCCEELLE